MMNKAWPPVGVSEPAKVREKTRRLPSGDQRGPPVVPEKSANCVTRCGWVPLTSMTNTSERWNRLCPRAAGVHVRQSLSVG